MITGGLKVLVNGCVRRCYKLTVDYDDASIRLNAEPAQDFDRKTFAVMSFTKEDTPALRPLVPIINFGKVGENKKDS